MNFSQLGFGVFALEIYGILLSFAFIVSVWHYYRTLQKKKFSIDFFLRNFWKWLMVGIIVGRLFSLFLDPTIFLRNGITSFFEFWDGRINFVGLLVGFLGMMLWNSRKSKMEFLRWIDAGVVSFFIGVLIVDIAGFLTGAVYGRETVMPWGVQYETFGVDILMPTHPVALYAFLAHCFVFSWIRNHFNSYERTVGRLTIKAGMFLFAIDFFMQFFRGNPTLLVFEVVRIEQVFDIVILVLLFFVGQRKVAKF